MLADDPLISVEAFGPRPTRIGTCSCTCCEPDLARMYLPLLTRLKLHFVVPTLFFKKKTEGVVLVRGLI